MGRNKGWATIVRLMDSSSAKVIRVVFMGNKYRENVDWAVGLGLGAWGLGHGGGKEVEKS